MKNLMIPAIMVVIVVIAGIFAFVPVQQASTVHTSETITIANDAITAAKFVAGAIDDDAIADGAIDDNAIANNAIDADAIGPNAIDAGAIADNAIDAATFAAGAIDDNAIASNAVTAAKIANDAIGSLELADAVEPLNNVLSVATDDLSTPLDATCGAGGDSFLVHYVSTGTNGKTLEIDLTDNGGAEITLGFATGEGLTQTGTVGGAAGATVEFTGTDANVDAIITVVCTGNGVPAIT